jgi:hypothetical protein
MEETFLELSIKKLEHLSQYQDNKDHCIRCDEIILIENKQKCLPLFNSTSKLLLKVGKTTSNFSTFDEFAINLTKELTINLIPMEKEILINEIKCLFLLQEVEITDIVQEFLNKAFK